MPQRELHKWARRVVVPQQRGHEREEVEESALGQRLADGEPAVALAQHFVQYVRMRNAIATFGRMGFERDHPIRRQFATRQSMPLEPDFERTQVLALQFNGLGRHRQPAGPLVKVEVRELLGQRDQIPIDVTAGGRGFGHARRGQLGGDGRQIRLERCEFITKIGPQLARGQVPAAQLGAADLADGLFAPLPGAAGKSRSRSRRRGPASSAWIATAIRSSCLLMGCMLWFTLEGIEKKQAAGVCRGSLLEFGNRKSPRAGLAANRRPPQS